MPPEGAYVLVRRRAISQVWAQAVNLLSRGRGDVPSACGGVRGEGMWPGGVCGVVVPVRELRGSAELGVCVCEGS